MDDKTTNVKLAEPGSHTCNTPTITRADRQCRDETQTPDLASAAGESDLEDLLLATAQVRNESPAEVLSSANTSEKPCHFMKLPPEIRVDIYERIMQDAFRNIENGIQPQYYTAVVLCRDRSLPRTYETALALLHTNRSTRQEALLLCLKLASDARKCAEAELRMLRPHWRKTGGSTGVAFDLPWKVTHALIQQGTYDKYMHLESLHSDIEEFHTRMQLVESNMQVKTRRRRVRRA